MQQDKGATLEGVSLKSTQDTAHNAQRYQGRVR